MARKPKKYHYIYKTTCKVTDKFYVGMHSTDNLEDGYLGSGKILGYSRKKYGDENHVLEILEFCSSRDELKQREKEIVCEALLADPLNINLKYGGDGGGRVWNEAHSAKFHRAGWEAMMSSLTPEQLSERAKKINAARKVNGTSSRWSAKAIENARHSEKRKQTMLARGHNKGAKNPNFGKRLAWIVRGQKRKRVSLEELDKFLVDGWVQGYKLI